MILLEKIALVLICFLVVAMLIMLIDSLWDSVLSIKKRIKELKAHSKK